MKNISFAFAEPQTVTYKFNPDSGYYQMGFAPIGFTELPYELKLEPTRAKNKIQSNWIIRGRIKNGEYEFFSGLRETNSAKILWGDRPGNKKSLMFAVFTPDNSEMQVYYFKSYYPNNATIRERNIQHFIEQFENGGI